MAEIPYVPKYDDTIKRNNIDMLLQPGDFVLKDGNRALTKWGDIMLNSEDYSSFFRLVQEWRYNYPTLKVLFDSTFDTFEQQKRLDQAMMDAFPEPSSQHPHPLMNPAADFDAYHRAIDEHGAAEVARGAYAGTIAIVLTNMLRAFKDNIAALSDEWSRSGPQFGGHSVGQALEASANNVRHAAEWAKTRKPTKEQLPSIRVLAGVLNEAIAADGSGHRFAREVSPEVLDKISQRDFGNLEVVVFAFAKDLMKSRQQRLPSQC